jgi:cell division protein FtsB
MVIRELRRRAQRFIIPSLAICLVAYFMYHLIQGGRGLLAMRDLEHTLGEYRGRIADLKTKHDQMMQKVSLLRPESLCPDLLEERAKAVLGYTRKNEQVVLNEELEKE